MAQGSNDLNMLLKAKVVKIKVELDYKNSNLPSQVNAITKWLKDTGKSVKLKVELNASITDMNAQLAKISKTIHSSKSFKPMKIGVEIDVKGSATKIKNQLKEIQDVVDTFNKNYTKQMQNTQAKIAQSHKQQKGVNVPMDAPVTNFNNIKQYVSQLKEAENIMKSKLGKGQSGLFSSFEIKDAKGNLNGFIATLEKANGVVEKVRYTFDQAKNKFVVVDRSTATATEKLIHRQMQALQGLQRELDTTGKHSKQLQKEQDALIKAGADGSLTPDMVNAHKSKIANTKASMQMTKLENDLLREQKKLIHDIEKTRNKSKGANADKLSDLKNGLNNLGSNSFKDPETKSYLADIKRQHEVIKQNHQEEMTIEKQRLVALEKKKDMINKINNLEKLTNVKTGTLGTTNLAEVRAMAQTIDSMERYIEVKKRMNEIDRAKKSADTNGKVIAEFNRLEKAMTNYAIATGKSTETIGTRFKQLKDSIGNNLEDAYQKTQYYTKKLNDFKVDDVLTRKKNSVVNDANHKDIKSAVDAKDVTLLKEYISGLEKAEIATLKLTTNNKGVSKITAQLASTGKTAKEVSYEIDNLDKKLRFMASGDVFNRNANLGIFEQLSIAMKRVPVWMVAMTAFHGSIQAVANMTGELLKIDKAVTNITRVASDSINVDTLMGNAVGLSSELGNNIHDILGAMEEFARTFGEFNERQLTDITKTAVLMSNVSDLTVEEATKSLVGTMNAFNISASESIRIVDSLNEVDNDYAISTKQLAEGLSKSASTAKTFGVSMEETVGHITSIGSVTMESGAIIGNSLKTIYSRITTLATSESILKGVNVEMYEMGENGEKKVKPVGKILSDLAGEWDGLTDEQRQNTAVSLAGRYQLSRFLAMMNNWGTATKATRTALSAQGSAMRENAKYMDSFEARINKLKNAFTELSMSVGDKVLDGAIFTIIEGLTSLAKVAINVVDSFGALPIVFAVIGIIAFKMKLFSGTLYSLYGGLVNVTTGFTRASAGAVGFSGTLAGLRGALGATTAGVTVLRSGIATLGVAMKGLLASTGIGLIFVGIGLAVEALIKKFEKQKRTAEKVKKANAQLVDSYRNTQGGLENLVAKQSQLQDAVNSGNIKEGTDAYNEYVEVTNKLAGLMPTAVKYIDQSGLAHLRESKAIQEQIKFAKELSKEKAKATKENFKTDLDKLMADYKKEEKAIDELVAKRKKLKATDGDKKVHYDDFGMAIKGSEYQLDNMGKIQTKNVEIIQSEQAKAEILQKVMKLAGDTSLAYLEADGKLKNLTDSGKNVVEQMIQQNEHLLKYADDGSENSVKVIEKRGKQLREMATTVGETISEMYEDLSKGHEDDPMGLEKINKDMDLLLNSLPDTFFKQSALDNADEVETKLKGVLGIAKDVEAGKGNFDSVSASLEKFGFSAKDADMYTANLGKQYKNSAILSEALTQAQDEGSESLGEWIDTAIEAIDISEKLFGYNDADLEAVKSNIEGMQTMLALRGEGIKQSDAYKESLQAVSLYLGVPEATIDKDLNYYRNMADLMGKVELKYDDATGKLVGFNKEGLNKPQIAMLNEMIALGNKAGVELDALTGKYYRVGTDIEVVKNKQGEWVDSLGKTVTEVDKVVAKTDTAKLAFETMFVVMKNGDGSTSAFTNIIGDLSIVNGDVDALKLAFENLQIGLGTPTGNAMLDGLISKLDITDGTINATKGNIEVLKQILGVPANVNLLNNGELETTKTKVNEVKESVVKTKEEIQKNKMQNIFNEQDNSAVTTKTKVDGVTDSVKKLSEVNVPSGKFRDIYAGLEGGAETSKGKVDVLVESIKKATDSAGVISGLNSIIDTSAGKARGLKSVLSDALAGFSNLASQSKIISSVSSSINGIASSSANASNAIASSFRGISGSISSTLNSLTPSIGIALSALKNAYTRASVTTQGGMTSMSNYTRSGLSNIINLFGNASNSIHVEVVKMTNAMRRSFKAGLDSLVNDASSLPSRIAQAIRSNGGGANGAMQALARSMASSFTAQLISSIRGAGGGRGSGGSGGGAGSFGAQSGEGSMGSTGGGDSGSSGIMVAPTNTLTGMYNTDGDYEFSSLAVKATNPREGIADAVSFGATQRGIEAYANAIALLEARMARLSKTNVTYRDSVKKLVSMENARMVLMKKDLAMTNSRQSAIQKSLKKLPALGKQTTKQRESYNKLQTEYNENLSKIGTLKVNIENAITSIKDKSMEIFTNFIDEVVGKYDKAIDKIKEKIDNIDFKIEVLGLVNPDDKKALLNAQIDKATKSQEAQATNDRKKNSLEAQREQAILSAGKADKDVADEKKALDRAKANAKKNPTKANKEKQKQAQKKYDNAVQTEGKKSEKVKKIDEDLKKVYEDAEDLTIATLQAEKEIRDTRASIADEGIKTLQDYHTQVKDMALEAIDLEKEALQDAHADKMKLYDEEIDAINSVYDEKIKSMDKEKSEADYQEGLDEKNKKKAELTNKITLLSRDTSLEGQKKLAEAKAELAELDKDIAETQADRADELLRADLEAQKQAQLNAIDLEKEKAERILQFGEDEKDDGVGGLQGLDSQKDKITKDYEDLMNNDAYWAKMRDDAILGNFNTLSTELGKMKVNLDNMNKGVYDGLFAGFKGLSDEVKKQVAEIGEIDVDNMLGGSKSPISDVKEAKDSKDYKMTDGKVSTSKGTKVTPTHQNSPTKTKTPPKKADTKKKKEEEAKKKKKEADVKKADEANRKITSAVSFRKSAEYGNNIMSTLPKDAKVQYIGMEKGWAKIKYGGKTGYVGSKFLKKFDTGGYTGDWAGNEGKVAMLHKKEQVLNERQTKDIFNTAKIIDKIKVYLPKVNGNKLDKLAMAGGINTNVSYGDINVTVEGGDKKKSKDIAKEILDGMKKKGR